MLKRFDIKVAMICWLAASTVEIHTGASFWLWLYDTFEITDTAPIVARVNELDSSSNLTSVKREPRSSAIGWRSVCL
ncbi:hypothetical protein F5Y19DRAFT_429165 [Xylariaceae sp. FL1651]|nr:hypothetical protein F5Y19DRAFT_429165 [Xylariaceae sp. FL1651]